MCVMSNGKCKHSVYHGKSTTILNWCTSSLNGIRCIYVYLLVPYIYSLSNFSSSQFCESEIIILNLPVITIGKEYFFPEIMKNDNEK